jgi:CDP-glycerol glycerophosphotransferase (TagB/SpsB family)|tara:strand:+ start:192 stop:1451 length:1260 start_codon:yes stop_codon:yes gene_type:complete
MKNKIIILLVFLKRLFSYLKRKKNEYFFSIQIMISSIIFIFIGKSLNLVIFGSKHGSSYSDNSRYLYEWINSNRPEINCIWLTRNEEIIKMLESRGLSCLNMFSLRGRIALKRATVGVISHSLRDIAPNPSDVPESIKLLQLFHGQCVKAVRFGMNEGFENNDQANERRLEAKLVSYAISTSDFMSDIWEKCMGFGRNKHVTTGYPRNDCLINVPEMHADLWNNSMNGNDYDNVILYAPTYRPGKKATEFFPFTDFDVVLLLEILNSTRSNLLLRPHLTDLNRYNRLREFLEGLATNERIHLATHDQFVDVNTILPFIDVLITDYSSMYHDFLLLDRPMIFVPYDYSHYKKRSGFLYDYFENLPGPYVTDFDEFCKELRKTLNDSSYYVEKRVMLKNKIHEYTDSNSCVRVSNLVEDLL